MNKIKKQLRRAFTLVELVVVIAVIAALAAILIPTFVNVLNSANQANDTSLVNYINTTLEAQEAKGNKPEKVGDMYNVTTALNIVADNGVDVTKLDTSASNADFVYNATDNNFLYYTDDFTTLYNGVEPDEGDVLVLVASSFDASRVTTAKNAGLTVVDYCVYCTSGTVALSDSGTTVTVWLYGTNNTTFTVNLPEATARDFSDGSTVDVAAIKSESFHVYGKYAELSLSRGHIVFESGAKIEKLNILEADGTKLTYTTEATVTQYNAVNGFDNIYKTDGAKVESVDEFVEDLSISQENVGLIVKNDDGTVSVDTSISGLGTKNNPYLATADNIDAILAISADTLYISLAESFETSSAIVIAEGYTVVLDLNGYSITASSKIYTVTVNSGAKLTIIDSSVAQSGTIENTNADRYALNVSGELILESGIISGIKCAYVKGGLTLNGGKIAASTGYGVYVTGGSITVNDGSIESNDKHAIYVTSGSAEINGGIISSSSNYGLQVVKSTAKIKGGSISGTYAVYSSSGTTDITGGSITGATHGLYIAGGTVTVGEENGDNSAINISGTNNGINNNNTSTVFSIKSGTVTGTKYGVQGKVEMSGGSVSGGTTGLYSGTVARTVTVSGGMVIGGETGINSNAVVTISGGTIYGAEYAIKTSNTVKVSAGTIGCNADVTELSKYGIWGTSTNSISVTGD